METELSQFSNSTSADSTQSTAKHTPRPWVAEFDDDGQESTTIREHGGGLIASVFGVEDFCCFTEEQAADPTIAAEMVANAHLIAAAPDLLAALKVIVADLPARRDWLDPVIEAEARAAIAKAEGRAQ